MESHDGQLSVGAHSGATRLAFVGGGQLQDGLALLGDAVLPPGLQAPAADP